MPSNDDANESGDRLDRFLIAGPTPPPRGLVGLDAFLAEPPLPPEPPAPPAARTTQAVVDPHDPPTTAEAPTIEPHRFTDDAAEAAVPPALASFQAEDVPSWAVADAFDEADPAPIAPPSFAPPDDLRQAAAAVPGFAAEAERSRGDDIASALAAHPLDDQMLADPSALLSASPPSNPTVVAPSGSARFDPWSSDGSPPIQPQPPAPSRFGRSSLAAKKMKTKRTEIENMEM